MKHLVSLYALCLHSEEQLKRLVGHKGKLWTIKQVEENKGSGLFSEYFEKEFPYLRSTVLLAESCTRRHDK